MSVRAPLVGDLGEHALIARITARLAPAPWIVVGPGDDAAVVEPVARALDVLTTDAVVDGVHVDLRLMPADAAGHRAVAANLSDLAAMGARPRALLLSFSLPPSLDVAAFDRVLAGIVSAAAAHRATVVGGNLTRTTGPLEVHVTALGTVGRRRALTRAGARPGDEVYVTGTLGAAALGLLLLRESPAPDPVPGGRVFSPSERRYLYPDARVRAGLQLGLARAATSCMDLSDGLADGLRQVSAASGVGMTIDAARLPIADDVRAALLARGRDPLQIALSGGDDYELLFTVRPRQLGRLRGVRARLGDLPITRIGAVTRSPLVQLVTAEGAGELPAGFEHFR